MKHVYVIQCVFVFFSFSENDVHAYETDSYTYKESLTWSKHFSISTKAKSKSADNDINYIDDVIYTSSKEQLVISGTTLYTISSKGKITSSKLNNNGAKNKYNSNNYNDRPVSISGACELDDDTHAFISDGSLYLFTFSDKMWTNEGQIVC